MANIKCPMCGKTNPADRETCQYCEARLRPVFPEMSDEEISKLLGLDDSSKKGEISKDLNSSSDDSLDWLYQIVPEEKAEEPDFMQGDEELPLERFDDWFNHPENGDSGLPKNLFDDGDVQTAPTPTGDEPLEPDWLLKMEENSPGLSPHELETEAGDEESSSESLDFHSDHLLIWNAEEGDTIRSEPDNREDLQGADLPSWLEAMKPVSALSPADEDIPLGPISVEGAGPLAGLEGVIPAEPDIAYSRKPFNFSVKLQVSDYQQAHAALLENLIHAEGKASVISKKEFFAPKNVLRSVLALLLILSILLTFIIPGLLQVNAPGLQNFPSAWAAYQAIEKISLEKPVLFAIDYQPGLSAEMDAVAGSVLKHLYSKKAKIVLVTTQPLGLMQAERLLSRSSQETGIQYLPSQDYANLGYIPGGHSGLLGFIADPRRVMPFAVDGSAVWQQPAFQVVNDISSFSSIIIATEDTDKARNWIEQLTSYATPAPIIMAVSAQVEPVVAPYFHASPSKIQGIIPGLAGAMAYESVAYHPGGIIQTYTPFSIVGLLAVIMILFGSVFNGFATVISLQQKQERNRGDGK